MACRLTMTPGGEAGCSPFDAVMVDGAMVIGGGSARICASCGYVTATTKTAIRNLVLENANMKANKGREAVGAIVMRGDASGQGGGSVTNIPNISGRADGGTAALSLCPVYNSQCPRAARLACPTAATLPAPALGGRLHRRILTLAHVTEGASQLLYGVTGSQS
jgi:hypothetical protein